jgi:hypothetical protein
MTAVLELDEVTRVYGEGRAGVRVPGQGSR